MARLVTIMLIGEIKQRTLGVHPHLSELFVGHTILLSILELLIRLGTNGDTPPTLKPKIVNQKLNTRVASQYLIRTFKLAEVLQAANSPFCPVTGILHELTARNSNALQSINKP